MKKKIRPFSSLGETAAGVYVHVFGTLWSVRPLSRTWAIVVVLNSSSTHGAVRGRRRRLPRRGGDHADGALRRHPEPGVRHRRRGCRLPPREWEASPRHHPAGGDSGEEAPSHRARCPFQPQDRKSQRPCKSITPRPPSVKLEVEDNLVEGEGESSSCS